MEAGVAPLDLIKVATLNFEEPDLARFPCLALAYQALRAGGSSSAVLNAANEIAVAAFLDKRIPFLRIPHLIEQVLASVPVTRVNSLADVLQADATARVVAQELIAQ